MGESVFVPKQCHHVAVTHFQFGSKLMYDDAFNDRTHVSHLMFEHGQKFLAHMEWALPSGGSTRPLEILDIGVGMGWVDVALHKHYDGHARFTFMDQSSFDEEGMALISQGLKPGYG